MKLIRKWLFPLLACLLVIGAAVLPHQISQARDSQLFGQVHAETLSADALPVAELPTLLDRMELFANQYSPVRLILSSSTSAYSDSSTRREHALALRDLLVAWDIAPGFFFDQRPGAPDEAFEHCSIQRLLLWDPAEERDIRDPSAYYLFAWTAYATYHNKSLSVTVDAETGLPIQVSLWDTNIAQWFPYTQEALADKVERYFEMMGWTIGVDVELMDPVEPEADGWLELDYSVLGTDLYYRIIHGPTTLNINLESSRDETDSWAYSSGYDQ